MASITHRITGAGLSVAGGLALVWWLVAAASGPDAYEGFVGHATAWYGIAIGVGLSWAFFQHTLSGIRHLVMDIGAGFELRANRFWATMTFVGGIALTALFWLYILGVK